MKLSTKGRYGLRAIIDLARYSENEPVSISSISAKEKGIHAVSHAITALKGALTVFIKSANPTEYLSISKIIPLRSVTTKNIIAFKGIYSLILLKYFIPFKKPPYQFIHILGNRSYIFSDIVYF